MIAVEVWQRRGGGEGQLTQNLTTSHLTGGEKKAPWNVQEGASNRFSGVRPTSPYLLGAFIFGLPLSSKVGSYTRIPIADSPPNGEETICFFVHCWHKWDARGCQLQGKNPPKGRVVYHSTRHHSWTRSEGRTSCWMDRKSWKEGEIFTSTCKFTTVHWWCRIFFMGFCCITRNSQYQLPDIAISTTSWIVTSKTDGIT